MKTAFTTLLVLSMIWNTSAQSASTIFGKGGPKVRGAYGVAAQKFSSIDGQFANFLGGYGGVLFDSDYMVGAGAFALLNGQSIDIDGDANTYRKVTYTGLFIERTFKPEKVIHFTSNLLAGAAFIGERAKTPDGGNYAIGSRGAFVIEPSVNAEINLTQWFRAGAGISYRWIAGESAYSAPAGIVSLKFGNF
jgi:hypothetical protein